MHWRWWIVFFITLSVYSWGEPSESNDFLKYAKNSLMGDRELKAGRFRESSIFFQEAYRIAEALDYTSGQVHNLMQLGVSAWNLGDLDASERYYFQARNLAKRMDLPSEGRTCLIALDILRLYKQGKALRAKMEYTASLSSFDKAILLAQSILSKAHEVKCLRQKGLTYWGAGRLADFRDTNENALVLARNLNHRLEEARCMNNMGLFYYDSEDFFLALKYFEESLALSHSLFNKNEESIILVNIGRVYHYLGHYKRALEYFNKAMEIDIDKVDFEDLSITLANIGVVYRNQGVINEDKNSLITALSYFRSSYCLTRNKKIEVQLLNNMGFAYANLKNYANGISCFFSALKKAKGFQDLFAISNIYVNIGNLYYEQGLHQKAIKYYDEAVKLALEINSKRVLWEAYLGLGKSWEFLGKDKIAEAYYRNSISRIEQMRSRVFGDEFKVGFFENKVSAYERLAGVLFQRYKKAPNQKVAREMLYIIECAKGRAFIENLADKSDRLKLSPVLEKKERALAQQISGIISGLADTKPSRRQFKDLLERLGQKEDEYSRLVALIKEAQSGGKPDKTAIPYTLEEIQAGLLDNETGLLEYFLGEKASWVFFVTRTAYFVFELPSRKEIGNSVNAFLKLVSVPCSGVFLGEVAARRIYRELLFPLEMDCTKSLKRLIIVPDGQLCCLPFEALAANDESSGLPFYYLIHRYQVSYALSASSLIYLRERGRAEDQDTGKDFFAVGNPDYAVPAEKGIFPHKGYTIALRDYFLSQGFSFSPLPYAEKEVREIASLFPETRRTLLIRAEGTEEAVKKESLHNFKILHFACHGFIDEERPMRSALVLALDQNMTEDGFLQAREIGALQLDADLVVLSGCQTAYGSIRRGEGILDLSRCFFRAGARTVVASLWRIEDRATAVLMREFYTALIGGMTMAQALRSAKLWMIRSDFSNPFFWAGFVLSGEGQSGLRRNSQSFRLSR